MKIAFKLSLVLCGFMVLILGGTLWLAYLSESRQLATRQLASIRAGLERLARQCQPAPGPDPRGAGADPRGAGADSDVRCLQALDAAAPLEASRALAAAFALDAESKVLAHTDFLSGDFSSRGAAMRDGWAQTAALAPGFLAQEAELPRAGFIRLYSMPLPGPQGRAGTVFAAYKAEELEAALAWLKDDLRRWFLQGSLLTAGVSMLIALAMTLYALAPLRPMAAASRKIMEGDFGCRVPEGDDEFGKVGALFNKMAGRLAEVDELKQSFVSKMTHDLRNPLAAMLGHADLLAAGAKGPLTEEQAATLETIQRNGYRLAELINNILDVTQLEAGRMELAPERLDIRKEIGSVVELLQVRADEFQVKLQTHLLPGLEQAHADAEAFRRILVNLVSNALKFTPAEGTVSIMAHRGKPNEVVFTVSDTGVGIPKDRMGMLFNKFSQVPETRNKVRPSGGTGLGLVICKELVELHGGRIWVDSEMFKGTAFHFSLPEGPAPAKAGGGQKPQINPTSPTA